MSPRRRPLLPVVLCLALCGNGAAAAQAGETRDGAPRRALNLNLSPEDRHSGTAAPAAAELPDLGGPAAAPADRRAGDDLPYGAGYEARQLRWGGGTSGAGRHGSGRGR